MRGRGPWEIAEAGPSRRAAWLDAATVPFWLDSEQRPAALDPLAGATQAGLVIVGAGLSGLWAAVLAKQAEPDRDVLLLEGDRIADAASGRNGGFFLSSLTHGVGNGLARFPDEMPALERLGLESFAATVQTIERHGIDCALELTGALDVAVQPHQVGWLAEMAEQMSSLGHEVDVLDRDRIRAEVHSPLYEGGVWMRTGAGVLDPARLCWGLAALARDSGVRIHEQSRVVRLRRDGPAVVLELQGATVRAGSVLLATSASRGLVAPVRRRVVPVYDYILVSEPLSGEQMRSIGWANRQGIGDSANQFHYYRLTADDRILFGGYDAIYHYGNRMGPELEQRERSFDTLAAHFFANFPQLEGLRFSHRWGGVIDTCSRFFAFYGTALGGRVAYAVGHTGLGVGASRFGAQVALDLLAGRETEATRLRAVQSRPLPFPPEPLRWAAIELTRRQLATADRRAGRRGLWLRALDRAGLGFDS